MASFGVGPIELLIVGTVLLVIVGGGIAGVVFVVMVVIKSRDKK